MVQVKLMAMTSCGGVVKGREFVVLRYCVDIFFTVEERETRGWFFVVKLLEVENGVVWLPLWGRKGEGHNFKLKQRGYCLRRGKEGRWLCSFFSFLEKMVQGFTFGFSPLFFSNGCHHYL